VRRVAVIASIQHRGPLRSLIALKKEAIKYLLSAETMIPRMINSLTNVGLMYSFHNYNICCDVTMRRILAVTVIIIYLGRVEQLIPNVRSGA